MREAAEGTDSEEEEERPRKRVHSIKKNAKVVKRKWKEPHPIHLDDIVLLFTPTLLQRISSSWVDCRSIVVSHTYCPKYNYTVRQTSPCDPTHHHNFRTYDRVTS